jgi:hypothetical protein
MMLRRLEIAYRITLLFIFIHVSNAQNSQQPVIISQYDPVIQTSSSFGYIDENAPLGTLIRTAEGRQSDALQIVISDQDLVRLMFFC